MRCEPLGAVGRAGRHTGGALFAEATDESPEGEAADFAASVAPLRAPDHRAVPPSGEQREGVAERDVPGGRERASG